MAQGFEANKAFAMPPIDHARDLRAVVRILEETPAIEREYMAPREEFEARAHGVSAALQSAGHPVGFVVSDEHYRGDVPYLRQRDRKLSPGPGLPMECTPGLWMGGPST